MSSPARVCYPFRVKKAGIVINPHLIFSQKLLHLYRRRHSVLFNHVLHGAVLAAFVSQELAPETLYIWIAGLMLGGFYQWQTGRHYVEEIDRFTEVKSSVSHIVAAGLAGLSFGLTALFFPGFSLSLRLLVLLMLGAIAAGALPRLAALPSAYTAYVSGLLGPAIAMQIQFGDAADWQLVPILLLMGVSLLYSAKNTHDDLMDTLLSRFGLENAATEDKLTGIPNRRRFDQCLDQEWRRAMRNQVPLSLILIDIDFFKKFNDGYGHQPGDECLSKVAKALYGSAQRASDLVARYGGEEFVVLLYHMTRDDAFRLAERMRNAVEKLEIPHLYSSWEQVTISLGGVSRIPREQDDPQAFVKEADKALYQAKENGRNRVEWYNPV